MRLSITLILTWVFLGTFARADPPSIVVVLADDLGYGDIGCYGQKDVKTPHLDRFASQGLRLTHCYSAHPNCSPARAGLLTGRTPFRLGVFNWIPMYSPMHLKRDELTIAKLLQQKGYDTCHVGKWHLNGDLQHSDQPQPSDHGFRHWFATQNNALPNHRDPFNFVRNGEEVGPQHGFSADLVAKEAVDWLNHGRRDDKPFFLFVCFHEPHEPIASDERFSSLYPSDDPSYSAHRGNVSQLDDGFGQLMNALEALQLVDETFVFFTSDNGPAITAMHPHGSAGPLRDKKGAIYEGGIRVPGIMRWPGKISVNEVSDVPVGGVDLLPTLCELSGIPVPQDRPLDGTSIVPIFSGQLPQRKQPLYWQFNRAKSDVKVAIRDGDWKLVAAVTDPVPNIGADITAEELRQIKHAELTQFAMYNLAHDVDESHDLSGMEPAKLAEMKAKLTRIFKEVQQEAPLWPEWEWPRYESSKIQWPDYWLERKKPRSK